jgi:hypothetical protein
MGNVARIFTVCAAAVFGAGCSGDDATNGGTAGNSGGGAGSGGGGAGTGDDAATVTDASADAPMSISCGTATCRPMTLPILGPAAPCCPIAEVNTCGAVVMGADGMGACLTTSMGTMDPSCPQQTVNGFPVAGCCAATGACGATLSAIGLGCHAFRTADAGGLRCGGDSGSRGSGDSGEGGS